jgi:hypothetical protein
VRRYQFRCPGNIGLMYCSDFFPIKTAKYAGNWDPKSKTLTYILQQKKYLAILFNKNMQVLIYGGWNGQTKTVNPFTASYYEEEKKPLKVKSLDSKVLHFVGTLVKGKTNVCNTVNRGTSK